MAKAIPEETRHGVATDYLAGMSPKEIKDKYNIGESTVYNIISSMKMSELTEKEPTAAATATDSKEKISQVECITELTKSQALRGVEVIGLMQTMLIGIEENFGDNVEVMSLKADSDTASIVFRYAGTAYSVQFGLAF